MAFPVGQDGKPSAFALAYYAYLRRQAPQAHAAVPAQVQRLHRAMVLARPLAS